MSNWRKIKEEILTMFNLTKSSILLLSVFFTIGWNIVIGEIFEVNRIMLEQSFLLICTICFMATDYSSILEEVTENYSNRRKSIIMALLVVSALILFLGTNYLVMYCWNDILAELLKSKVNSIEYMEACFINLLFNFIVRGQEYVRKGAILY